MIRKIYLFLTVVFFISDFIACEKKEVVQNTNVKEMPAVIAEVQTTRAETLAADEDVTGEHIAIPDNLSEIQIKARKELTNTYSDSLNPLGDYFWDEFGEFKKQYALSIAESEILGIWVALSDDGVWMSIKFVVDYYFYPNNLFMIEYNPSKYIFTEEEDRRLYMAFGVWHIENDIVKARIYSFLKGTYTSDDRKREFFMVTPYEIEIIDSRSIDPVGYSTKHFSKFVFPPELAENIRMADDANITYRMARSVFTRSPLQTTKTGELKKLYSYFDIIPDLAKNNLSGIDIATDVELLEKYFSEWKH